MAKKKEPKKSPSKRVSGKQKKDSVPDASLRKDVTGTDAWRIGERALFSKAKKDPRIVGKKPLEPDDSQVDDFQDQQREIVLKEFFASDEELEAVGAMSLEMYQDQHGVILRAAGVQEYLSFALDNEIFAVNIFSIKEIIKPPSITEVPRTEPVILGILSLRGTIAPVVDLRRRLGLKAAPNTRKTRILLVFWEQGLIGLLVDEVRHVVRLRDEDIEPPPGVFDRTEAEHILGVGRQHGEMYTLLDLSSVIQIDRFLKVL